MMKKTYQMMAAALLTAGALLTTACSSDDDAAIENITPTVGSETIQFTATLAPKDGATTRAITTDKDANNKEILNVKWEAGEQIFIYYETTDGHASTTATVESVDESGVATITAEFAANAKDNGDAKFVYPATLATAEGDIDESQLLNNQNGRLCTGTTNISKNFDATTQTGKISVMGGTASVKGTVAMENRVCICKFHFWLENGTWISDTEEAGTTLYIIIGDGRTYTISSPFARGFKSDDVIYVAMLPFTSQTIFFASTKEGGTGYYDKRAGSLAAGKFYRNVSVTMTATTTLTASTGDVTLNYGDVLMGTGGDATHVTIADGATVTLINATIPGRASNDKATKWAGITCEGNATIILVGTNYVRGYHTYYPGVQAGPMGTTLTIKGSGSLTATTGLYDYTDNIEGVSAGIGGGWNMQVGNIRIEGGTITASGNYGGAGIGSGNTTVSGRASCGNISITGGTVTATGGRLAAGIGSGYNISRTNSCGNISITGGTVTATGGEYAVGIGSGANAVTTYTNTCGTITITSPATVTATAGSNCSHSIGADNSSTCGTVTIGGTNYGTGGITTSPFTWPTP